MDEGLKHYLARREKKRRTKEILASYNLDIKPIINNAEALKLLENKIEAIITELKADKLLLFGNTVRTKESCLLNLTPEQANKIDLLEEKFECLLNFKTYV